MAPQLCHFYVHHFPFVWLVVLDPVSRDKKQMQDAAEPNRKPLKPPRLTGTASNRAENRTGGTGPGNGTEPEKPDRAVRNEPAEPDIPK